MPETMLADRPVTKQQSHSLVSSTVSRSALRDSNHSWQFFARNAQGDASTCSRPMPPSRCMGDRADPALLEQPQMELPFHVARGAVVMNRGVRRSSRSSTDPTMENRSHSVLPRSVHSNLCIGRLCENRPWRTEGTPRASLQQCGAGLRHSPSRTAVHVRAFISRIPDTQLHLDVLHIGRKSSSRPGRCFFFLFHGQGGRDALAIVFDQVSVLPAPQLLSQGSIFLVFSFDFLFGRFPSMVSLQVLASQHLGCFDS